MMQISTNQSPPFVPSARIAFEADTTHDRISRDLTLFYVSATACRGVVGDAWRESMRVY